MKKFFLICSIALSYICLAQKVVQKIEIKNGFYEIPAVYTYDDKIKNQPLVIMLHGSASNKDEVLDTYVKLADSLYEKGISSIRFDFIGTGDSKVDYLHYTPTSALSDTNKVIDYAKSKTKAKIGLLGWSEGGTIAILAGSNKNLNSLATWAAATDLLDEVKDLYDEAKKNGFAIHNFEWRSPLKQSLQWFEEVQKLDVLNQVKKIDVPIMALSGTNDTDVNPNIAKEIVKYSKNKKSKFISIKDSDHIFNLFTDNVKLEEGINKTTKWFDETLK